MVKIFYFGDCEILLKIDNTCKRLENKIIMYKLFCFRISVKIQPASQKKVPDSFYKFSYVKHKLAYVSIII